jgi:hypothetical protein
MEVPPATRAEGCKRSGATDPGGADDLARAPTTPPPPAGPRRRADRRGVRNERTGTVRAGAAAYAPTLPADRR